MASAPTEVRIGFDDPVTVGPGNAIVAADRSSVLAGSARVERAGHDLVLPLQNLGNGDYSVRWAIVSDDGHLESGSLAFRVGPARAGAGVPRSVLEAESGDPSAGNVFARWFYLGGILVAGGIALFRLLVSRAGARQAATLIILALTAVVFGGSLLLYTTHGGATRFTNVTGAAIVVAIGAALATALAAPFLACSRSPRERRSPCSSPRRSQGTPSAPGASGRFQSRPISSTSAPPHSGSEAYSNSP